MRRFYSLSYYHWAADLRQREGKSVFTFERILAARLGSVP